MLFDVNGDGVMDRGEVNQLLNSINVGDIDKNELAKRVDDIFRDKAKGAASWKDTTLTFDQLVTVADDNPDLFNALDGEDG